ncbi:MAG: DUF3422 domain-containing protein [Rhodospirillaceae bacterium]|jgi:uncharacterized membrane-anchored protein|nr:DUF3422 domain-containing protein [Rhodospirillaceae bacterium]
MMFQDHPFRQMLANELHARPYGRVSVPAQISHLALASGEGTAANEITHLKTLCSHYQVAPPPEDATLFTAELGPFRLKWERHTEFSAYTFIAEGQFETPFKEPAIAAVPADWLAAVPGEVIAALHIAVEETDNPEQNIAGVRGYFDNNTLVGGLLNDGQAGWWTDFVVHGDGFSRFLMRGSNLRATTAGRITQRIAQMETYRMMAMLALPHARAARPLVADAETRLSAILQALADPNNERGERELLKDLTDMAAETEKVSGELTYRFSAARAYAEIVRQRVRALREIRVPGIQPAGDFLLTRFEPAMETCDNLSKRLEALGGRVARASNLLRTRVDVALEEQNRDLLRSMDRRARLQLRLQETVEGLSVAAISYYVVSLVIYMARGAQKLGSPFEPYLVGMISFPFVVAGIWYGVRRVRKAVSRGNSTSDTLP